MDEGHALALAFDSNSEEFVRGVEVGRLWEMLQREDELEEQVVHVSNAEMVLRLAEACGRTVRSDELDGHWIAVRFGRRGSLPEADESDALNA